MSRIGGVVNSGILGTKSGETPGFLWERTSGAGVSTKETTKGHAHFGWSGAGTPLVVLHRGIMATLDGIFFNGVELVPNAGSDVDRLVELYRKYGMERTLQLLNGDFAGAVWDDQEQTLWLFRDRFGIHPLHFCQRKDGIAFSSRPFPLGQIPGIGKDLSSSFIALYAASHYRYFDNDLWATPYRNIRQLPAAHLIRWQSGKMTFQRYWDLENQEDWQDSEGKLAERYRSLILDAVQIRMQRAERPVFTLSGGMDSSSVLAAAVHLAKGARQPVVSTVYSDKTYDESEDIQSMLGTTALQWHPLRIDVPDVLRVVEEMIEVNQEPVPTATWLSHFMLCREMARQGFSSLFGGLGGDELNAGEYEYFYFHFADLRRDGKEKILAHEVQCWARYHDHPIYKKNQTIMEQGLARLVDLSRPGLVRTDPQRLHRYTGVLCGDFFDLSHFDPVLDHPFTSYLRNRTYQDLFRETIPCCLRAEDRQTSAFGLSHFLPFLDYRLAEFMFRVPGHLKIRDGITKRLLREAMRGLLPEETRTRIKKTGWNAPAHLWFSGKGLETLRDLVHSQEFRQRGIYKLKEVDRILCEHDEIVRSGRPVENHMMFLWQLVNLELWLRWHSKSSGERRP